MIEQEYVKDAVSYRIAAVAQNVWSAALICPWLALAWFDRCTREGKREKAPKKMADSS